MWSAPAATCQMYVLASGPGVGVGRVICSVLPRPELPHVVLAPAPHAARRDDEERRARPRQGHLQVVVSAQHHRLDLAHPTREDGVLVGRSFGLHFGDQSLAGTGSQRGLSHLHHLLRKAQHAQQRLVLLRRRQREELPAENGMRLRRVLDRELEGFADRCRPRFIFGSVLPSCASTALISSSERSVSSIARAAAVAAGAAAAARAALRGIVSRNFTARTLLQFFQVLLPLSPVRRNVVGPAPNSHHGVLRPRRGNVVVGGRNRGQGEDGARRLGPRALAALLSCASAGATSPSPRTRPSRAAAGAGHRRSEADVVPDAAFAERRC